MATVGVKEVKANPNLISSAAVERVFSFTGQKGCSRHCLMNTAKSCSFLETDWTSTSVHYHWVTLTFDSISLSLSLSETWIRTLKSGLRPKFNLTSV